MRLRKALYAAGLRFRVNYAVQRSVGRAIRVDIALPGHRTAIFVDGCFWHRCPEHGTRPTTNSDYWDAKLEANVRRDSDVNEALIEAGWAVIRLWEHEPIDSAVDQVRRELANLRTAACVTGR